MNSIRKFSLCMVLCLAALCGLAFASQKITVNTDMRILVEHEIFIPANAAGEPVMVVEYQGTTYAPLRALAEVYGLTVGYDGDKRLATVSRAEGRAPAERPAPTGAPATPPSLSIDVSTDMQILVNDQIFVPKNAAGEKVLVFEYQGTTYAPLRALAEAYDLEVTYDPDQRMASVAQVYDVVRVVDGDTIVVEFNGVEEKVRLIGIDTPESVHPDSDKNTEAGMAAAAYTKQLLEGKKVSLEFDVQERDRYGRLLAYAYLDGKMVNKTLLEEGYANLATYPPNVKYVDDFVGIINARKEQEETPAPVPAATPTPPASPAPTPTTTQEAQSRVYVTKTGRHYHYSDSCNGGTYYESTLAEAKTRGLTPCNKCVK